MVAQLRGFMSDSPMNDDDRLALAEAQQEASDSLRTLDAIAEYVGCPHDEELTVDHVRRHYANLEEAAQRQGVEDGNQIARLSVPPSLSTGHERIIDLLDSLQAAVDNIQGIADGDDIPSTAIRNCARAAIDRANQYLNAQAIAPSPNGFEAGLRQADILRSALLDIKAAHVPDQPAHSQADETTWVMQHVGTIRRIASKAIEEAAAIAALPRPAAEESVSEWLTIDSAPKDGTEIILSGPYPTNKEGIPTNRVTAGFWCVSEAPIIGDCGGECRCPEYGEPEEPRWASMHGGSAGGWMSTDGGFTEEWPPTHWQPLPSAALATFDIKKRSGI